MVSATKSILIADDEENVLLLLRMILADHGDYRVILARNGEEALAVAGREHPDLIVLDIDMPKLDGLQVCGMVKRDPRQAGTKIIMLTAMAQDSYREMAAQAGADDFLTKPFSIYTFEEKVRTYLNPLGSLPG